MIYILYSLEIVLNLLNDVKTVYTVDLPIR